MLKPIAVVSGATGGIGQVVVHRLLQEGYAVTALGRRQEALDALHRKTNDDPSIQGFSLSTIRADMSRSDDIARLKETIIYCDLLVTCHGAVPYIRPTATLREEAYDMVMDVDLRGTFLLARLAGRNMLDAGTGGSIVFLSSFHAIGSYPQRALYAMAKAGVCALARALACEWAGAGIRVNAIAPGQVEGPRTKTIAETIKGAKVIERMRQRAPAGKLVQAADIAETVVWLTKTPSVNGQTVVLDHGVTASLYYEPYPIEDQPRPELFLKGTI